MSDETANRSKASGSKSEFAKQAEQDAPAGGIAREFLDFLRHNKKWWLLPLVLVLLLVGVALFAGGGAAAPFIYTLF
ncbi:MAG: DUF5989 family protein [Phycisphaerales bacterium]